MRAIVIGLATVIASAFFQSQATTAPRAWNDEELRSWATLADGWLNLAFLVVASVLVAVVCRNFIVRAESFGDHLVRAAALSYLGCFVYLTLCAAALWARSLWRGGLANMHDTLSLYLIGMTAALLSFFIVIPYGLLCQYLMHSAFWSTTAREDRE